MKKLLLTVISMVGVFGLQAQTLVDQLPHNKKVLLEEYTGINCVYCPDGHKIASQFEAANPGNVFLINIHQGGYATPSAGQPDFRTNFGDSLANQTGLTGYPSGTVNRHVFSGAATQLSRSAWVASGTTIMSQASYVNLGLVDTFNLATRELKVVVEMYFTGTTAPSSVNLNVALLQDNVQGPQTGGATYNPTQVLPNGKYNHMHMLRHMLTGQWGEVITTTTQGTLVTRTYTYTLPSSIRSIPVEIGDLSVVAFVVQGKQEIITAAKAANNYLTPAGVYAVDLTATHKTVIPGWCEYSVTPKVMVKNLSTSVSADTFNVQYISNGGTPVVQNITTPLAAGDSLLVTFPSVALTSGSTKFDFSVNFNGVTHLIDMAVGNSSSSTPTFYTIANASFGTKFEEGFESVAVQGTNPPHSIAVNPSGGAAFVINKALVSGLTQELGGYGTSTKSFFWNFYNIAEGNTASIVYEKLNCSANTGYGIKFNYAYAQYATENDKLMIEVSYNCGSTWATLYSKQGSALATAPAVSSGNFWPTATQWKSENISLPSLDGKADAMLRISGVSAYGNNLFIDNVILYNSTNVGIESANENSNSVEVYPNPASTKATVAFNLDAQQLVNISIYNSVGELVSSSEESRNAGEYTLDIDVTNLSSGFYTVNLKTNNKVSSKKLTIVR